MSSPIKGPLQETVRLSSGYDMPTVALGAFFGPRPQLAPLLDHVKSVVRESIDVGYRHIDTAWDYGTEKVVGEAVREKIAEGVVTREQMFITTKLSVQHHDPAFVKACLQESLKMLGLDYVDLYLIHCPVAFKQLAPHEYPTWDEHMTQDHTNDHLKTWKAMENCVKEGLCRSIGISNFNIAQTRHIVDNCEIKPVTNQVELHPYLIQRELVEESLKLGVTLTAYTPLGQGHSCWVRSEFTSPLKDPVMEQIASKHKRSAAQIALRYQIQRGVCIAVKSSSRERLIQNRQIYDFELTDDEMEQINKLDKNFRSGDQARFKGHKDCPF